MRSYFFSADTQEDMLGWVRALSQSAMMEPDSSLNRYSTSHHEVLYTEYQALFMNALADPFLLHLSSFQAVLKLSGFHTDRWQQ